MNKIFIAYNTDSIVNLYKKIIKFKKDDFEKNIKIPNEFLKNKNFFSVSANMQKKRIACFLRIKSYYEENGGKNNLYMDILNDDYKNSNKYYHIERNEEIIKDENTKLIIFVVSDNEISFWQLQEAFYASYYNKKISFLSVKKFLKFIRNKKLDNYICKKLK